VGFYVTGDEKNSVTSERFTAFPGDKGNKAKRKFGTEYSKIFSHQK